MSVYMVQGKLGGGKSLVCVGKILDYLRRDMKVATNLDIYLGKFARKNSKRTITRLPDKPRVQDLELLGEGNPTADEENNGLIVLDECGTWLNSRTWNDPERQAFVDWMLHARKLGWDLMFIIQDITMLDKQIKMALCEHLVICRRLDRLQIPVLSRLTKLFFGFKVTFPKVHRAKVHYGDSPQDLVADVWTYQAKHLYKCYDTRQVFKHDYLTINHEDKEPELVDFRSTYTVLSRWHTEGRYLQLKQTRFPVPKSFHQLLVYPAWIIIQMVVALQDVPARRVGAS